jgi:F-type H+-transporting ATPase subunit delta
VLVNVVQLLIERNRMSYLPDIARAYRTLADAKSGRVRGSVVSATPLDADSVRRLEQALEQLTQRNVVLEASVDPGVLGGVSAQVGSVVYDGTLRTQLDAMRRNLAQG